MREHEQAILRQKLNGTRVPTTQGQSSAPTEVDLGDVRSQRRAIRDVQWVVDAIIGKALSEDDLKGLKHDVSHLKTALRFILIGGMAGMVVNIALFTACILWLVYHAIYG